MTCYPQLAAHLAQVDAKVREHENDAAARLERGELHGWIAAIWREPSPICGKRGNSIRKRSDAGENSTDALTQLLQAAISTPAKSTSPSIAPSARWIFPPTRRRRSVCVSSASNCDNLTRYYTLVAQGRERQGRLLDALQAYRELVRTHPAGERLSLLDDPGLEVRGDLWMQTQIAALMKRAAPETASQFKTQLEREWKTLSATNDLDAVARFAALFGAIKGPLGVPGREARLRLAEQAAASANRRLAVPTELELLALQQEADSPDFAARALYARARLLTRHGQLEDALAVYRTLGEGLSATEIARRPYRSRTARRPDHGQAFPRGAARSTARLERP